MKERKYRKFYTLEENLYPAFAYHKVLKYILSNPKCLSMHLTTTDILQNIYSRYCKFIGIFQYSEFEVNPLLFIKLDFGGEKYLLNFRIREEHNKQEY